MGRPSDERRAGTARDRARRASEALLRDLRRFHGRPPPDVRVGEGRDVVAAFARPEASSGCSSSFGWLLEA